MSEVRIAAEPREEFGKGAARRLRRAGKVPAVIYGHGQPPRHVSLPGHDLMLALKGAPTTLLSFELDGSPELALTKDVVRDPIKGFYKHLDLLLVRRGEQVSVSVPVVLVGDADRESMVDLQLTSLTVLAEATHIPAGLTVDITGMTVGDSVTAAQVVLPRGTTLDGDPEQVVVQVLAQTAAEPAGSEGEVSAADPGTNEGGAASPAS